MITRTQGYVQLPEPVRFSEEWERSASLALREGKAGALADYAEHGRIRAGTSEEILDAAAQHYVAHTLEGKDSLLIAPSHELRREACRRIRDDLVAGLPWAEGQGVAGIAEAAFAIAPPVTRAVRPVGADGKPIALGRDLALLLDAGSQCAAALGKRVIFLSDVTLWLSGLGLSWERIGVNFPAAQDELEQQKTGLLVTASRRAHMIFCSAARNLTIYCTDGNGAQVAPEEREPVRASFEARLNADWPSHITQALVGVQPAA